MKFVANARGKRIAAKRTKLGLSQEQLAQLCGCGVRTIQRVEAGTFAGMNMRIITALSEHLDIPIDELVLGKSSTRRQ